MSYTFRQSPHKSSRDGLAISAIVLHFTASASLSGAVDWFMNPVSRVSAHYVVGRDGEVVQTVHEHEKAWHAGQSSLFGDPRVNSISVGIEIVNWGELKKDQLTGDFFCWPGNYTRKYDSREFGAPVQSKDGRYWAPYTEAQYQAVIKLCRELAQRYPEITHERIVGHEHVAPGRKTDPGPAFDLERVRDATFPVSVAPDPRHDDPTEEELVTAQADRAEPKSTSWVSLLLEKLRLIRGKR